MRKRTLSCIILCCIFLCGIVELKSQSTYSLDWARKAGSSNIDISTSMAKDGAGNIYITGYFEGIVDFDPGPATLNLTSNGQKDGFVVKLDPSGNLIWAENFGGSQDEFPFAIASDSSGNVYLCGKYRGTADFDPSSAVYNLTTAGSSNDIFVMKLRSTGAFAWAGRFGNSFDEDLGSLALSPDGVCVAGSFVAKVDFDPGLGVYNLTSPGYASAFVCKIDTGGIFSWATQFGGGSGLAYGISIVSDAAGNTFTSGNFSLGAIDFDPGTGTYNLTPQGTDIFICKLDDAGIFVWAKKLGGSKFESAGPIALDRSGNVISAGYYTGSGDFDPGTGTFTLTSLTNNHHDTYISKLDPQGNFIWALSMGGPKNDIPSSIAADSSGNIYVSGCAGDSVDVDPGTSTKMIRTAGLQDIFIIKLNASGNYDWSAIPGGTELDSVSAMLVDASGNVFMTGAFGSNVDFDPGKDTMALTSAGLSDIFIIKLKQGFHVGINPSPTSSIFIYPNPAHDWLNLELSQEEELRIYDMQGRMVLETSAYGGVDISSLQKGSYILVLKSGMVRFMKE